MDNHFKLVTNLRINIIFVQFEQLIFKVCKMFPPAAHPSFDPPQSYRLLKRL